MVVKRTVRVGYESHNYGGARNTYAPIAGVDFVKQRRVPIERVPFLERRGYSSAFVPLGPTRCDVIHLWNRVSFGRSPWGASFEWTFPNVDGSRYPQALDRLRHPMFDSRCRFLIAISEHAKTMMQSSLSEQQWAALESKIHVALPAHQFQTRRSAYTPPDASAPLRLLFVGVTFFGKGGEACLRAVEEVGDELNLELTVVSPVLGDDYGGTPPADVDVRGLHRRLESNDRIRWHPRLDNADVLNQIEHHHLGLLPTFADTFGYAVLEFMGLGVPTIVSNVQALPEFTGVDTGWTVQVPVDDRGVWLGRQSGTELRKAYYHQAVDSVAGQLVRILRLLRERPELLDSIHRSSVERLADQFDPEARGRAILQIYQDSLS